MTFSEPEAIAVRDLSAIAKIWEYFVSLSYFCLTFGNWYKKSVIRVC
ncbi:MAG: hypothetical protein SAL07_00750 [Oscillatoria sp. PMC 1051.18]|nr:hypothetical protein [Oscillatoria sp. PMC 1050.18]MEC5028415.1 hypothetical protein [Oscillatoria sp. PMC 1051.18]